MKQFFICLFLALIFTAIGWFANIAWNLPKEVNPVSEIKPRPLAKYEIENLIQKYPQIPASQIKIGDIIKEEENYTSYEFSFSFDPGLTGTDEKKVTGLINIPNKTGKLPLVIMFRGFVSQEIYQPGMGSMRAGEYFANEGFITIAPDFLGYGESSREAQNIFESRFQTYTTALSLIKSIDSLTKWDRENVFIWAHSNGGQIALTALEVSGANYPTILWAPNSAKFPYSIIYYLNEAPDNGKLIITELSKLMADYDTDKFAFNNYLDKINAPLQLNQGTMDPAIPTVWSDALNRKLEDAKVEVKYHKYPGADHNMNPSWETVIENGLSFYKTFLNL